MIPITSKNLGLTAFITIAAIMVTTVSAKTCAECKSEYDNNREKNCQVANIYSTCVDAKTCSNETAKQQAYQEANQVCATECNRCASTYNYAKPQDCKAAETYVQCTNQSCKDTTEKETAMNAKQTQCQTQSSTSGGSQPPPNGNSPPPSEQTPPPPKGESTPPPRNEQQGGETMPPKDGHDPSMGNSSPPPGEHPKGSSPPPKDGQTMPPKEGHDPSMGNSSPPPGEHPKGSSPPPKDGQTMPPKEGNDPSMGHSSPPPGELPKGSSPPPKDGQTMPPKEGHDPSMGHSSPPPPEGEQHPKGSSPPPSGENQQPGASDQPKPPQSTPKGEGNKPPTTTMKNEGGQQEQNSGKETQNGDGSKPSTTTMNSNGDQKAAGEPVTAKQTEQSEDTCPSLDACVRSFISSVNNGFVYTNTICSGIRTAMKCFNGLASGQCSSYNPYSKISYTFVDLLAVFTHYCTDTERAQTSCNQFETCFSTIKTPEDINSYTDAGYWCAVLDSTMKCGMENKNETGCAQLEPSTEGLAKIQDYCPNAFDVRSGKYIYNDGNIVRSSIMALVLTMMAVIKNWL